MKLTNQRAASERSGARLTKAAGSISTGMTPAAAARVIRAVLARPRLLGAGLPRWSATRPPPPGPRATTSMI
jgi:hypothetical protein